MADWKKIRKKVGHATNVAIEKTGELADMASLHVKLKTLEAKRKEQYAKLGKLTYRQLKSGESQAEKIAPVVEELDALHDKICAVVADIEVAKQQRVAKAEAQKAQKEQAKNDAE